MNPTVLICGAGVAGPALAARLARHGFRPTVVERAQGQRSSGNPVDVRGDAVRVARQLGILPRLHEAATHVPGLVFVTASGRRVGPVTVGRPGGDEVEIGRADLARILREAAKDDVEFLFDDTITALHQDAGGVDVTFAEAEPRRFDLVLGADGLHSAVRRLVFGPEERFVRHLGLYIATMPLGRPAADPAAVVLHSGPGRTVAVHPVHGEAGAAFMFRHPAVPGLGRRDVEQQKRIVLDAYAEGGWEIPELLDRLRATDELYFDSISRVRLPTWSHGRVALLGDAASCVSLFGDGSSLALIGADTLASALAASPGDHVAAFKAYERRHRAVATPKQRYHRLSAAFLIPRTRAGVLARDFAMSLPPRLTAKASGRGASSAPR